MLVIISVLPLGVKTEDCYATLEQMSETNNGVILGVDIGGTKTLVATFDSEGKILSEERFETPATYGVFLTECKKVMPADKVISTALGIPGVIDRTNGVGMSFGNLTWKNVPIKADMENLLKCPVVVENDAKVAAVFEADKVKSDFKNVLYLTIGTGIGIAYISSGVLDLEYGDHGGNHVPVVYQGKEQNWESLTSGKAITTSYGKQAREITDVKTWQEIAYKLALGVVELLKRYSDTDVVIIGGGVGVHFDRFGKLLEEELGKQIPDGSHIPPLMQAKYPEEAVIRGCYLLATQKSHG